MESGIPHACYAVLDDGSGTWAGELIAVSYDWNAAGDAAEQHGRPDIAHAIRTGFVGESP